MSTLGRRLAGARHEAGLTLLKLGELSGLSEGTIRGYEAGRVSPPLPKLQALAAALGKPVSYFLDDQPATPPDLAEELAKLNARIAQIAGTATPATTGGPYPGVEALLADDALCAALQITDHERHLLRNGYALPVGPATKAEAITLLNAIRAMTARRP